VHLAAETRNDVTLRSISIGKIRGSQHDLSVRESILTPAGLRVGEVLGRRGL
jgi:hypothetical protein